MFKKIFLIPCVAALAAALVCASASAADVACKVVVVSDGDTLTARGLWADANPTPPWAWRKVQRSQ